jgi:SAM-dependent methyltransferase
MLRDMELEIIKTIKLDGKCLDLGGGANASYRSKLVVSGELHSVNLDAGMAPDILADLNVELPVDAGTYDAVISFNTLEHIENDFMALSEMMRVLKPGGHFHLIVPFLYRVHGAPCDYHRHTHHEWEFRLLSLGLSSSAFTIKPIVWDPISSGYSLFESAFPRLRWLLRPISMLPGLVVQVLKKPKHGWVEFALAYYISGEKK